MTWERVKAGHYRYGIWEVIQARRGMWEVWHGDFPVHNFRTLAQARSFVETEVSQ